MVTHSLSQHFVAVVSKEIAVSVAGPMENVFNPSSPSIGDSAFMSRSVSIQEGISLEQSPEEEVTSGIEVIGSTVSLESAPSNEKEIDRVCSANPTALDAITTNNANSLNYSNEKRQVVQLTNAKGIN